VIRVFPRRTKATPNDHLARVGRGPCSNDEADEVHVSVSFTWDLPAAERLARLWSPVAPVKIGGPATGERGEDFVPGRYVKPGYVITSRGCPNRCWFCSVWRREGQAIRELPIRDGVNVLDDNLLACSPDHVAAVFAMLRRMKALPGGGEKIQFTGGLEAAKLEPWHAAEMKSLRPGGVFFAYDTPDDLAPLQRAGQIMAAAGFRLGSHRLRAYVLVGGPKDTRSDAEHRIAETMAAGFLPMAMLYRDQSGTTDPEWRAWARLRARPMILCAKTKAA
jgi:hypothetical protein